MLIFSSASSIFITHPPTYVQYPIAINRDVVLVPWWYYVQSLLLILLRLCTSEKIYTVLVLLLLHVVVIALVSWLYRARSYTQEGGKCGGPMLYYRARIAKGLTILQYSPLRI